MSAWYLGLFAPLSPSAVSALYLVIQRHKQRHILRHDQAPCREHYTFTYFIVSYFPIVVVPKCPPNTQSNPSMIPLLMLTRWQHKRFTTWTYSQTMWFISVDARMWVDDLWMKDSYCRRTHHGHLVMTTQEMRAYDRGWRRLSVRLLRQSRSQSCQSF